MESLWTLGRTCLKYKVIALPFEEMGWLQDYCAFNYDALEFQKCSIRVGAIKPTQCELFPGILAQYVRKTRLVDAHHKLPWGVRLACDPTVYLMDGHHRWVAAQIKKRKVLRMMVADLGLQISDPEYEKETVF